MTEEDGRTHRHQWLGWPCQDLSLHISPFEGPSAQTCPVGTQLRRFAWVWAEQIKDPWVMKVILEGHCWEFVASPGVPYKASSVSAEGMNSL